MSNKINVAVVGAGPAGLTAATEIAKRGGSVVVFDENSKPGGQLFKQIHKFFGSEYHGAGVRGFRFGEKLMEQCDELGVDIRLNSVVFGAFPGNKLGIATDEGIYSVQADRILFATGATEKPLPFKGWDLPGVMGAGAAQTMANMNRVKPGNKAVMVGSGNVGLVVSYQLLQAGTDVVCLVEGQPQVNGYKVHADKLRRQGVPILTGYTIVEARGKDKVEEVVLAEVDERFNVIEGTEKIVEADLVCIAVGLQPALELIRMTDIGLTHILSLGGYMPLHNENMKTTNKNIYVAGDIAGIEEASTAMEEGRLAGISICRDLEIIGKDEAEELITSVKKEITELRKGSKGKMRSEAKEEIVRRYAEWNGRKE